MERNCHEGNEQRSRHLEIPVPNNISFVGKGNRWSESVRLAVQWITLRQMQSLSRSSLVSAGFVFACTYFYVWVCVCVLYVCTLWWIIVTHVRARETSYAHMTTLCIRYIVTIDDGLTWNNSGYLITQWNNAFWRWDLNFNGSGEGFPYNFTRDSFCSLEPSLIIPRTSMILRFLFINLTKFPCSYFILLLGIDTLLTQQY